jgi:hypothetical protein
MKRKTVNIAEKCMVEMFKRVGLDYSMDEIIEYGKKDQDWYWLKTWTTEEEDSFRDWMDIELKKKRWNKKMRDSEVSWFLLMYGWKICDADQICSECGQSKPLHKMGCESKGDDL